MGISGFFTWLASRYPLIKSMYHGPTAPQIDWFFIDMNSIIYKYASDSFVVNEMTKEKNFEDIYMSVLNYLNGLTQLINPKKLLFLAFDGVAPRAKMTTQRSRSFKKKKVFEETYEPLQTHGLLQKDEIYNKYVSTACISKFMHEFCNQIKTFIQRKMMEDERWRKLHVIFSGVDVPGEGEHKIIDYIHAKTQDPEFDPNTSICIYGSDADLIVLALTTHLPFVCIIREQFQMASKLVSACKRVKIKDTFEFVWINILREYLEIEFESLKDAMGDRYNLEKIIDDFVFLLLFCGNDFLPRVSCIDIRKGYLDELIDLLKEILVENDGYINEKAVICWPRAVKFLNKIKTLELQYIKINSKDDQNTELFEKAEERKEQTNSLDNSNHYCNKSQDIFSKNETFDRENHVENKSKSSALCFENANIREMSLFENYRQSYYATNFNFNVQTNPKALIPILTAYMEGLQYILSYYYLGCPSWNWFYPYYYPPLLFDLSNLMRHCNLTEDPDYKIIFEKGKPPEPFKEFILTTRTDRHYLLPQPLRNIVCDEDSPLRRFYPEDYEVDPFGGVFESEFIAKIPFVDLDVLDSEYDRIMKKAYLKPEDKMRNTPGANFMYVWDESVIEREIKSTLTSCFNNFKVKIRVKNFLTEELPFNPFRILNRLLPGTKTQLPTYPSLHFVKNKESKMITFEKRKIIFDKWYLNFFEDFNQNEDLTKFLGQHCHYMYPFLVPCKIIGLITPDELVTDFDHSDFPFRYIEKDHQKFYNEQTNDIEKIYSNSFGILFEEKAPILAIVSCEDNFVKDCYGNPYCRYPSIKITPLSLICKYKCPDCQCKKRKIKLPELFPESSDVIINRGDYTGSTAKVIGHTEDQVEVQIVSLVPDLTRDINHIIKKYAEKDEYYTPESMANELGIDVDVLLNVLDSVFVELDPSAGNERSLYPQDFDLGLNLISRYAKLAVPELIRCEISDDSIMLGGFPYFIISAKAKKLIMQYFVQFKEIFYALQRRRQAKDNSPLTAKKIFPNSKNPNLEVIEAHIWLFKQDTSSLLLANAAARFMPRLAIIELQFLLDDQNHSNLLKCDTIRRKTLLLTADFLIPNHGNKWISPYFNAEPPCHEIGDRVVNLKINENNYAPFGAIGTVIGILGNPSASGIFELKIEVLFDYPFIGGTNLEGRCEWGRGAVVGFDNVFNLDRWQEFTGTLDETQEHETDPIKLRKEETDLTSYKPKKF